MGGVCTCRNRDSQVNAGSILDRVISQAGDEAQCLLYRLANYKKGGELIEAYNHGGLQEVEQVIKEQFGILMYANGKGQIINRAEYLRWKFRDQNQVILPIEASLSRFDPLSQWNDHEACWQMQYRGSLGETLLHVLIICDSRAHTRIARSLIKCFPRLAIDVVEGEEYLGASALHLAIAYNNNELVQDLVEAGAIVSQRAIGSFFLPRDQQRLHPARVTDYEGLAYLGEYPLAWAACCANESVYNLLLDSGANPDEQDSFGNMILHMVVVGDKLDMFGYALRHPKLPARNGIVNTAGFTPLTLACQLGRAEVFREMLELSCREFWRYSNITCSAYPLNALDTLLPDGRTNWNSAMFIILNGTKEEHLDMLDGGIIQRLLEEKWKTFARLQFLKRLIILVFHLTSLSVAVYFRPAEINEHLMTWPEEASDVVRSIAEIITILGVLNYVLFQLGGEIINIGFLSFFKQLSHEPAKLIFLVSNILILACIPFRIIGHRHLEDAILVVAVPGSWFLLMFFAGAIRLTGPFVTMVYSMITGDMLTFGIIYTIVLFGFSQSFYFLYKGFPGVKSTIYHSYHSTWMALFQITMGDYSYTDLSNTTYPNLSKTVFAIFMVLVPILLLNMLIAMMGNTYAHVIEQSEKEWMKQWAKIVVSLERAVSQSDAHNYLQEYSIKLGTEMEGDAIIEQRGVMVIKSKSKTRAKQRKGAVSNWKRVGKVTISELRKRGLTGEELRRIMWGRASFSTPVKTSPRIDAAPSAVTGGVFGEALTAALDVMTFSQDINVPMNNKEALNVETGATTTTIPKHANQEATRVTKSTPTVDSKQMQKQVQPVSAKPAGAMLDSSKTHQADASKQYPFGKQRSISVDEKATVSTENVDPFLDLIIATENKLDDQDTLLLLANSARLVSEGLRKQSLDISVLEHLALGTMSFKEVKPAVTKKKLQIFIESSDNEMYEDRSQLGTEARLRRIRSASGRIVPKQSKKSSRVWSDTSTNLSADNNVTVCGRNLQQPVEVPRETQKQVSTHKTSDHLIKQNESHASKKNLSDKNSKRRLHTAKNRISPTETEEVIPNKATVQPSISSAITDLTDDPLEPWSTCDIKDMNTLLAWKEPLSDSSIS